MPQVEDSAGFRRQYCEGGGEPEKAALAKSGGSQWSQGVVQTRALQGTGVLHY